MIHLVVTLNGKRLKKQGGPVEKEAAGLFRNDERLQFCSGDREAG
jgi:hypothetical protein